MASGKYPRLPVSSLVSKLAKANEERPTFLTRGYIASADDRMVRLYLNLTLDTYVDIPRSAVLHAQQIKDDQHERSELMLDATAQMTLVHEQKRTLGPGNFQQALTDAQEQMKQKAQLRPSASAHPPADACAEVRPSCGCGAPAAAPQAAPSAGEPDAGPDLLRMAGKQALGPFGFIVDLF
jgi:hypothetical protein